MCRRLKLFWSVMTWFMSLFLLIAACVLNYVICVCNWKDMSSFILGIFAFSFILCLSTSCLSKVLLAWQLWLPTDSQSSDLFLLLYFLSVCFYFIFLLLLLLPLVLSLQCLSAMPAVLRWILWLRLWREKDSCWAAFPVRDERRSLHEPP